MSDNSNSGDKTLHMSQTKTLSLKRPIEQGMVRQSFSHGRTKAVVVEKVKRRIVGPGETRPEAAAVEVAPAAVAPVARAPVAERPAPTAPSARQSPAASRSSGVVLRTLTEDERDARSLALVEARKREEIDRKQAEIEAKLQIGRAHV